MKISRRHCASEEGNAILEFVVGGVLFLIPMVYIMLGIFEVQRGWYGIAAGARDASRVHSLASTDGRGRSDAETAVQHAMQDQGIDNGWTLELTCEPSNQCLQSGSTSVATVTYDVTLPFLPEVLSYKPAFQIKTTHRTPYGLYRQDRP